MRLDAPRRFTRARLPTLVLAAAVGGALAAGCGGGALSKTEYLQRLETINKTFSDTIADTFNSPELQNPSELSEAATVIRRGADQVRDATGELEGLNPPSEVEGPHDKLVSGLKAFADDLDRFADAAASGNIAELQQLAEDISSESLPSMTRVNAAIDEFKGKGYDIE